MTLNMIRGNTKGFDLTVTLGGAPYSLSGANLYFTAKSSVVQAGKIFQKTIGDGITITNAAAGTAAIELEPNDTKNLPSTTTELDYDIELEKAGKIYTLVSGKLVVAPDVTTFWWNA